MEIEILNCFCTAEINSGNPAAIVNNFVGDANAKQTLAKELNFPVTVFLVNDANYDIEFFYPETEMPLCLHGSIAAAYTLFKHKGFSKLIFTSKNAGRLVIRNQDNIIQALVSMHQVPKIIFDKHEISKMLNINNLNKFETELPFELSSIGSPKLLIPLKTFATLANLKPDFNLIRKWSQENTVNGFYVYTKDVQNSTFDFYARGFNPKTGHNEDAATGVAAAALALSLRKSIRVGQGIFMNHPSIINVSYTDPENIWVGGKIVFQQ